MSEQNGSSGAPYDYSWALEPHQDPPMRHRVHSSDGPDSQPAADAGQAGPVLPGNSAAPAHSVVPTSSMAPNGRQVGVPPVSPAGAVRPAASGVTAGVGAPASATSAGWQPASPAVPSSGTLGAVNPGQPGVALRPPSLEPPPRSQAVAPGSSARVGLSRELRSGDLALDPLLRQVVAEGASDLHLTIDAPPTLRHDGSLRPIEGEPPLEAESLRRSVYSILTQKQRERFEDDLELDFAYQVPGGARFRVNLYQQREALGAAFRVIPSEIKSLAELKVPAVVGSFAGLARGLVLVTGPTGSGKSTTLAAVIDEVNRTRADHIMTVEDPIEFLHHHKRALVNQREVGEDTHSFASALKHVLRQDPDIILVGEMRDLETISVALTAAETGHLVFATLHTQDAAQTIDRVIDVFPPSQQDQVRVQLASTIQGVVCQTLCRRSDGPGRVVATEIMVATPAIRNLIREGKTHQIYSSMQAGAKEGMHTLDQHLADLTRQSVISYETGLEKCQHVADFNRLSGRDGTRAGVGIAASMSDMQPQAGGIR